MQKFPTWHIYTNLCTIARKKIIFHWTQQYHVRIVSPNICYPLQLSSKGTSIISFLHLIKKFLIFSVSVPIQQKMRYFYWKSKKRWCSEILQQNKAIWCTVYAPKMNLHLSIAHQIILVDGGWRITSHLPNIVHVRYVTLDCNGQQNKQDWSFFFFLNTVQYCLIYFIKHVINA